MSSKFFGTVGFEIEDFMPQRMKVSADIGDVGIKSAGKQTARLTLTDAPIAAHVQADYLFGRPVAERPAISRKRSAIFATTAAGSRPANRPTTEPG